MPMHILFGDWFLFLEENYFKNHLEMYLNVLEKKKEKKKFLSQLWAGSPFLPRPSLLLRPSHLSFPPGPLGFLVWSGERAEPSSPRAR
jgi:hypothetical protein